MSWGGGCGCGWCFLFFGVVFGLFCVPIWFFVSWVTVFCVCCVFGVFWGVVVGLFWVGFGFWCGGLVLFLGVWCALRLSPARIPARVVFFGGAAGFCGVGIVVAARCGVVRVFLGGAGRRAVAV